jgi:hypothetical protein
VDFLYSDISPRAYRFAQQCYYKLNYYQSDTMPPIFKHNFAYAEILGGEKHTGSIADFHVLISFMLEKMSSWYILYGI